MTLSHIKVIFCLFFCLMHKHPHCQHLQRLYDHNRKVTEVLSERYFISHKNYIYIFYNTFAKKFTLLFFLQKYCTATWSLYLYREYVLQATYKKRSEVIGFVSVSADTPGYYINSRHSNTAFSVNQDTL